MRCCRVSCRPGSATTRALPECGPLATSSDTRQHTDRWLYNEQPLHTAARTFNPSLHQHRKQRPRKPRKRALATRKAECRRRPSQLLSRNATWMKHALRCTMVLRRQIVQLIVALRQEAIAIASFCQIGVRRAATDRGSLSQKARESHAVKFVTLSPASAWSCL